LVRANDPKPIQVVLGRTQVSFKKGDLGKVDHRGPELWVQTNGYFEGVFGRVGHGNALREQMKEHLAQPNPCLVPVGIEGQGPAVVHNGAVRLTPVEPDQTSGKVSLAS
jgi:hypothetical protein